MTPAQLNERPALAAQHKENDMKATLIAFAIVMALTSPVLAAGDVNDTSRCHRTDGNWVNASTQTCVAELEGHSGDREGREAPDRGCAGKGGGTTS